MKRLSRENEKRLARFIQKNRREADQILHHHPAFLETLRSEAKRQGAEWLLPRLENPTPERAVQTGSLLGASRSLQRKTRRKIEATDRHAAARLARLEARFEKARNHMALANLQLAMYAARRAAPRAVAAVHEELLQEACEALLKAAASYDPERGVAFNTYAMHVMALAIAKARDQLNHALRINPRTGVMLRKATNAEQALRCAVPGDPDEADIAKRLGISEARLAKARRSQFTAVLHDVPDPGINGQADTKLALQKALLALTKKERDTICQHYGIGCEPRTYTEIGRQRGVTREAIRQQEAKILQKMLRMLQGTGMMARMQKPGARP